MIKADIKNNNPHHSDTVLIQRTLQQKINIEVDDEACENMEEMCLYREKEINRIEEDIVELHTMYKEIAHLVNEQQADIEKVTVTLQSAEKHVEQATQSLQKKEENKRCVIL